MNKSPKDLLKTNLIWPDLRINQ